MKKGGLIILVSLLGLVAILAATLYFLGRSEKGHQLVVEKSLSALEQALEAHITIGGTSGNLLGRLAWNDVTMVREDLEVKVERLSFKIDYLALRNSHIRLTGFKAVNPRVTFKESWLETGTPPAPEWVRETDLNPDQTPPAPPGPGPEETAGPTPAAGEEKDGWRVSLDGASLDGGSLQGLDLALGQACLGPLNDVTAKVDFDLTKDFKIRGVLSGLVLVGGRPVRLEIKGGYADRLIEAPQIKIGFGPEERSALELKGHFDPHALTGQADYAARMEPLDLHQVLSAFRLGVEDLDLLEGGFDFKGRVDYLGGPIKLTLQGDWQKAGLELRADFDPEGLHIRSSGQVSELDPVRLAKIAGVELPPGKTGFRFDLQGTIPDSLNLDLELDGVDLEGYGRAEKGKIRAELEGEVVTAKATLNGLAGFKAGIENLDLDGRLDSQGARAQVSFTNAKGYKARADSGRFQLVWANDSLVISDLDLAKDQGRITGSIRANLDQGRLASGQADLNLAGLNLPSDLLWDLLGLYLPVVDLSSVRLTGPIKADWPGREMKLSFPGMKLDSPWGKIEGPGMVKLTAQGQLKEYALDLDVSRFAVPGWLWSLLPVELKRAIINGRLKVKGDPRKAVFEADLGGTSINGKEIKKLALAGKYSPQGVFVDGLDLSFLGTEIKTKGQAWPRLDLQAEIKGDRPEKVMDQLRKMGLALEPLPFTLDKYGFQGQVSGAYQTPGIKGRLALTGPALDRYRADKVDLDLDLEQIPFNKIEAASGKIRARIRQADWGQGGRFDLDLTAASSEGGLGGDFDLAAAGLRAGSKWTLAGNFAKGLDLVLNNLEITLPKGAGSETWRSVKPLELNLDRGSLSRAEAHLAGPGDQSLELDLRQLPGAISGRGRLQGLDLSSWATALGLENVDRGFLSLDLELGGSLEQPSAKMEGRVRDLVLLGKAAGQVDWTLNMDQGRFTAGLAGRNQGRDFLRATARMDLLPGAVFPRFPAKPEQPPGGPGYRRAGPGGLGCGSERQSLQGGAAVRPPQRDRPAGESPGGVAGPGAGPGGPGPERGRSVFGGRPQGPADDGAGRDQGQGRVAVEGHRRHDSLAGQPDRSLPARFENPQGRYRHQGPGSGQVRPGHYQNRGAGRKNER